MNLRAELTLRAFVVYLAALAVAWILTEVLANRKSAMDRKSAAKRRTVCGMLCFGEHARPERATRSPAWP